MKTVIAIPDFVSRVTYQNSAYWTRAEPNKETVWLETKTAVRFFHIYDDPLYIQTFMRK
jgi:hypothetical protein